MCCVDSSFVRMKAQTREKHCSPNWNFRVNFNVNVNVNFQVT